MSYSNIKRCLSAALILAFASPGAFAVSESYSASLNSSFMPITSDVRLTEKNDLITLSLRDSDVKQVLRMFADKAGMNIVFHNSVDGKVTLDLVNTPINDAFNLVLQIAGLSYYKQGNTMIVLSASSSDNASFSKQEMMIFPVNYVSAAKIADFLNKNVFGMKKIGMSSTDAATVNPATNELIVFGMPSDAAIVKKVIEQFDREPALRTFVVNHTTPAEMANMICSMLLPAHGLSNGGGAAVPEEPSSGGMDRGYTGGAAELPEEGGGEAGGSAIKLGEGIVACSVSTGNSSSAFDMQSLSIAYFPQRGTISVMGGSDSQAKIIEKFIKTNDVKQPQAMLEVSIVELNEAGSKEFENQWNFGSKHWQANFDGSKFSGGRPGGTAWTAKQEYIWDSGDGTGAPWAQADENGNPTTYNIPQQIMRTVYQQVPSVHINWVMNYLIENRKARVLANPKILITNGQESVIDLTQDYVEKVTSEYLTSSMAGVGTTGTAQKTYTIGEDLGIKVTLIPFISPEGYVTLNIKPDYSTISDQIYASGQVHGEKDLAATLLSRRNLDLKNIRIKDGETLVLGGMIQEVESKSVNKIPFLGDLPLIGSAFRSTSTSKTKSELVIMITPKILTDGEEVSNTTTL